MIIWLSKLAQWLYKWRVEALFFGLSCCIVGLVFFAQHLSNQILEAKESHTKYVKDQAIATQELNQKWFSKYNAANEEFIENVKKLNAERDALKLNISRMSESLDTAKHKWATAPPKAQHEYTEALSDVFQECVTEYSNMAVKADGHLLDAERLSEAWPEVQKPP